MKSLILVMMLIVGSNSMALDEQKTDREILMVLFNGKIACLELTDDRTCLQDVDSCEKMDHVVDEDTAISCMASVLEYWHYMTDGGEFQDE